VDGLSFEVRRGEVFGFLGPNGAGKTTTLRMIATLVAPDAGTITIDGVDAIGSPLAARGRMAYVPAEAGLPERLTPREVVRLFARIQGVDGGDRLADALLDRMGATSYAETPCGDLSTGMKRRVVLARALVHEPRVLLLDEPTDGLDPVQRDDMLSLIRRIGTEFGIDVVLSSHLLDEVERVCDAAVILGEGRVLAAGPLDELRVRVGGWTVELDGGTGDLAAALVARGATVEADAHRLRVDGIAGPGVVRDLVADLGLALVRLQRRRLSLEDVFLDAGMFDRPGSPQEHR
jgi:ABC-2 type transport system ATP-binding protein